ncbi:MAG: outer membrane beta-barrel family protein [Clostridium sp.]|nr:outer membrane beta-barrel family protein [Clostridium sp.]
MKATRFLIVTRNDTTIYDLDALNLKSSALLREAFEKLPGMSFRNGVLYHNGREVKRVLINGMDFSSKDPLLALQALPSYIMKHVKVYERKSDFAMRYDVDDGKEELVADVTVRRKYMGTWTGEVTAGGGTDGRFMGKIFGNTFTDQLRISLFGNANNINEQMWYNGDGKERAGETQAGDNSFYTPGATFFWKNKKGMRDKGYFFLEGGIDYNKEIYDKEDKRSSELFLSDGSMFSASDTHSETDRDRLAGHLKVDWNISKLMTLNYFGSFDTHWSRRNSTALQANWNENPIFDGGSIADTLKYLLSADSNQPNVIDLQQKKNDIDDSGANYSHELKMTYKIPQNANAYLIFAHRMNLGCNDNEEYNSTYYKYFNNEAANSTQLNRLLDKNSNSMSQGVMARAMKYFNVKGLSRFCLYTEYNYKRNTSTNDERGYLLDADEAKGQSLIDDETTRHLRTWINRHSVEVSLSATKVSAANVRYSFEFKPVYHYRSDELTYLKRNLSVLNIHKDYSYISGNTQFRRKSSTGNLIVRYYISPKIPDINQLVTYPDMADPQYIILGNENLRKGTTQGLASWYTKNFTKETENGKITRTLNASMFFNHSNNDITNFTTYDRNTGVITIKPVNVSGNRDGKVNIGFTTPLDVVQRFWLETFAEASVLRTQTYLGVVTADNTEQQFNDNRLHTYTASIKPRLKLNPVDFSVAYELTAEDNHGTYASANGGTQWQHLLTGKLDFQLPWHLDFNATLNYHNYAGYISGKRENWVMLDLGIERAFFKKENLFVRISGNDLFNQNDGFLRQYSATVLTHTYQKTLGRYGMLTLKYRFSSAKK